MSDLKNEAEALGIDVDGRWSEETLKEKIAEAKAKNPQPATQDAAPKEASEELYPIRLLFDWWDDQGNRHPRGETVDVPFDAAKKLIDGRKAARADAFSPKRG
ncbi:MAG: hypothetical protein QHC90_25290 [Shinella sp.]|nr:hypothetical protein [Shinella sp.]